MSDRAYELKLMAYEPYWQQILGVWIGAIVILALIEATQHWLGKEKPGEFAKLLGLVPLLTVMALPPLASLLYAFRAAQEYGLLAAIGVMIGGPLLAIFVAAKFKQFLIWVMTGFGRDPRKKSAEFVDIPASEARGATLNGKPIER